MLINKLSYKKKEPFRDANLYIIICEGEKREVDYFNFFNGLSSKLKVHTYGNIDGRSSPNHVIKNASIQVDKYDLKNGDEVWIILDTDHHIDQIPNVVKECKENNWFFAISNPCFEVWLYYHIKEDLPNSIPAKCSEWKRIVSDLIQGGFNSNRHPTLLKDAIKNSKSNYKHDGFMPEIGSTNIFELGEKIYSLTEKIVSKYIS